MQTIAGSFRRGSRGRRLVVLGLVSVVVGLVSGCAASADDTSARASSSVTPSSPPPASATATDGASPTPTVTPTNTLGPKGYGTLKLGMSYAAALATGELGKSAPSRAFPKAVKNHPEATVCLTKAGGLMAIFGDATMATPEGIHLGSSLAEVRAAYPNLDRAVDFYFVPTSATTRYEFLISGQDKAVYQWNISTTDQTCFN